MYDLFPKTKHLQIVLQVERRKIDEMRLPEKITYTLPPCDATSMKVVTKLLNETLTGETLLETEQLNVQLSLVSNISYNRHVSSYDAEKISNEF